MKSLQQLADAVRGDIRGDPFVAIAGVGSLEQARAGQVSFFASGKYRSLLKSTQASALLVPRGFSESTAVKNWIEVDHPALAFGKVVQLFHPAKKWAPGIAAGAHVHPEAQVHPSATVMAGAAVEKGAQVGARVVLFPGVFLGAQVSVGEDSVLYANVSVMDGCRIGQRCLIHPSAVVGSDGFGFVPDFEAGGLAKVPQVGIAVLEDDVELGAGSCIDRAALGETRIGRGTKIDNLVQVGHNVQVGPHSVLCSQVGIAGSSRLGAGVILGGQVGVADHLVLGDGVKVSAQSGVGDDWEDQSVIGGSPAMKQMDFLRFNAARPALLAALREIRKLRQRVESLEQADTTPGELPQ